MDAPDIAQLASLAHSQIPPQHQIAVAQDEDNHGTKRKADGGQQGQSKARRSRYISLACNECKRRKIKCNGETPCQRCGNLNLECVYAPNCCTGFKDSQEYKDMSAHIGSLQDQINMLYDNLNALRAQFGQSVPLQQQPVPQPQYPQSSSIDPLLQAQSYPQPPTEVPNLNASPQESRPRSQQQTPQQSFRGLTSAEFNLGVAKSSLQTMGIHTQSADYEDNAEQTEQPEVGLTQPPNRQLFNTMHESKDPIWRINREDAIRLCKIYDDETSMMFPVVDVERIITYTNRLYRFIEAMHRSGLMQQGLPGSDAIEDEDTNILKMVLATALTAEGSGQSELGRKLFECVQPTVDTLLLGTVNVKGIRLLVMTAVYEFQRDNEGTSWRLIGLAARLCIELGLHRREIYDAIQDEAERSETILLFWACYVLDRRWSLVTGMPFALQDADIDPALPRPGDRHPFLMVMIRYSEIGSKVWRALAAPPSADNGGLSPINIEEMNYLDYQVLQWQRSVPPFLQFEHIHQDGPENAPDTTASRANLRSKLVIYLRANQMRILIHRPVLHSATTIVQHRDQARKVVDIAKDSIRVLTHINRTTELYRTQQVFFHSFLTSALAVLFLAVSHTPVFFAEDVREEFFMALDLIRDLSKGSLVSKRLWRTIRTLKEVAPQLGMSCEESRANASEQSQQPANQPDLQRQTSRDDIDPNTSAAVAMAGLAGHNVDEAAFYGNDNGQGWASDSASLANPELMANDLTRFFEVAGAVQANANGQISADHAEQEQDTNQQQLLAGLPVDDDDLSNVLKELF